MSENLNIITTYNERENIEKIIEKIFSFENALDILIVDDDSLNGTA